jgi:hypothetical protein
MGAARAYVTGVVPCTGAASGTLEVVADGVTIEQDKKAVDPLGYGGVRLVPCGRGAALDDLVGVAAFACARPKILLAISPGPVIWFGLVSAL